jgi:hypothetical protein
VGGPTVVYDLKYDAKTSSIYYIESSSSGKGCPPELKSVSVLTGEQKVIFSCDDVINEPNEIAQAQSQKIYSYTSSFASLIPINLKENEISISIDYVNTENVQGMAEPMKTNFMVEIFQGGTSKIKLPISGCNMEQPFVVNGYRIPGVTDKNVLLISGKSDCWEGGYIRELIFLVPVLQIKSEATMFSYVTKSNSPLVPDEGSLVVYPTQIKTDAIMEDIPVEDVPVKMGVDINKITVTVIGIIVALLVGIVTGRLSKKSVS